LWRYTSFSDLAGIARAALSASALVALVIVLTYRTYGFSRGVLLLDLLFVLVLMTITRVSFRMARRLLPTPGSVKGRPVLIYGAGDAGELLLRELLNNGDLGYLPVGFVDDDPKKAGRLLHGLRVHAAETLPIVCRKLAVQEVIISTSNLSQTRERAVAEQCTAIGVSLRQMRIQLSQLNSLPNDARVEKPPLQAVEPLLTVRRHGSTHVVDASFIVHQDRAN
jgi:UDP-GlcNAc:undecaprenyl-phosphate GlcNAc-1-phosphate transferase